MYMEMKWIKFENHRNEIIRIRREVFVKEQSAPSHTLESTQDYNCPHFAAFENNTMVGVVSLVNHGYKLDPFLNNPIITRPGLYLWESISNTKGPRELL